MVQHMLVVVALIDCLVCAEAAGKDALVAGVFVLHMRLEGDGLDGGVRAVATLVRLLPRVAHLVSSQGVVVASHVGAHVTSVAK